MGRGRERGGGDRMRKRGEWEGERGGDRMRKRGTGAGDRVRKRGMGERMEGWGWDRGRIRWKWRELREGGEMGDGEVLGNGV